MIVDFENVTKATAEDFENMAKATAAMAKAVRDVQAGFGDLGTILAATITRAMEGFARVRIPEWRH